MEEFHILIIDDDEVSNFLTERAITSNWDWKVSTASNGIKALEFLKQNSQPDVILLDLNMPLLNGIEFIEKLETTYNKITSKIYILSTSNRKDDIQSASKYDCVDGYIEKPLEASKLRELLSR